jgi:hypothetical protein
MLSPEGVKAQVQVIQQRTSRQRWTPRKTVWPTRSLALEALAAVKALNG